MQVFAPKNSYDLRRLRLMEKLKTDLVIDVGANAGQYAESLREFGYQGRIDSFEPLPDAFESLKQKAARDSEWSARQLAIGSSSGKIPFHIAGNSVSSSVLPMEKLHETLEPDSICRKTIEVDLKSLNEFETDFSSSESIWLKVDVQGYEAEVLKGISKILPRVEALELELSLRPLYQNAPLYEDIIQLTKELGFRLAGIEAGFLDNDTGEVYQMNGIFLKDSSALEAGPSKDVRAS